MSLAVQVFLRENGTLDDLLRLYAIKAKRHPKFQNLVMLKYSQIDSPFAEEIVQDCRGIILDESRDWGVVCYTLRKFFNFSETLAATIQWPTARVEEKVDGSLMQLYHYAGEWHVASSGTPDAGGFVMNNNMTDETMSFAQLFWKTFKELEYSTSLFVHEFSYAFELMTPLNKVVVPHTTKKLALLCVRNRTTGQELAVREHAAYLGLPTVKTFQLQSWDECVEAARSLSPAESEGYVVVDANWNRVKMKSPAYVALAHLRDSSVSSAKAIVNVVRNGESTEFLAYFPEWQKTFDDVRERYASLVSECDAKYATLKHLTVRKEFALEAQKFRWPAPLYLMFTGKIATSRDFFKDVHVKHLMEALRVEDTPAAEE
jgi:hypothetical protein